MGVTPLLMGALRGNIREAFPTRAEVVGTFMVVQTIPGVKGHSRGSEVDLFLMKLGRELGKPLQFRH